MAGAEYPDDGNVDYGQAYHQAGPPLNVESLKVRIKDSKERIVLLEEIKADGDARLKAQAADIAKRDQEIEEMKQNMERELLMNNRKLSDAALAVREREKKIHKLENLICRKVMSVQSHHKLKYEVMAQARKELQEETNRAGREQRPGALDVPKKAANWNHGSSSISNLNNHHLHGIHDHSAKDMGQRSASSGAFFSRAAAGSGPAAAAANGWNLSRAWK